MKISFLGISLIATSAAVLLCLTTAPSTADTISAKPQLAAFVIEQDRASIQSSYDEMNAAFTAGRIDEVGNVIGCNYTQIDPKGHVLDKPATIKKLQGERSQMLQVNVQYAITSVTPCAAGMLVGMQMHVTGTGQKKILFMKIHGTFTNDLVAQDLWTNTPSGWVLVSRKESVDDSVTRAG